MFLFGGFHKKHKIQASICSLTNSVAAYSQWFQEDPSRRLVNLFPSDASNMIQQSPAATARLFPRRQGWKHLSGTQDPDPLSLSTGDSRSHI